MVVSSSHTDRAPTKRGCMLKVGDQAPDFVATAHTGETVRLRDFSGRTVILWFYPKADTPG